LVVLCVAAAVDVGELIEVTVAVASGVALGASAVVPAHAAMRTERKVVATSLMPVIMQARALRAL
jgi:hypothetical protein